MKINFQRLFVFLLIFFSIGCNKSDSIPKEQKEIRLKAASFNIRLPSSADVNSGNGWDIRKFPVTELIKRHEFDIIGVQEPYQNQIDDLDELLPDFDKVTAPYATRSLLAIYYKKSLFQVLDEGMFWLSETPDVKSMGWDADEYRIVHWAKLIHKESKIEFYFFNTHFYWKLQTARKNSGPLTARKVKEIAKNEPVILVGDFNSIPTTSQIQRIKVDLNDTFDATETERAGPINTNLGGGNFEGPPHNRIDYIFVSKNIRVLDFTVHDDKYGENNRYPSDHLPISSNLIIKK